MGAQFLIVSLLFLPLFLFGAETTVINEVSASASTGGNSASGSQDSGGETVVTGSQKSEVKIYTEINGEVVEDIHEEYSDTDEVLIDKKSSLQTEGANVETEIHIELNASSSSSVLTENTAVESETISEDEHLYEESISEEESRVLENTGFAAAIYFWGKVLEFFKNVFSWLTFK